MIDILNHIPPQLENEKLISPSKGMGMAASRLQRCLNESKYPSFVALIAAYIVIITGTRFTVIDDAYISFRYAFQLAEHGTLVYNLGEQVEGMTNLLWTLLLAVLYWLFNISMEQAALISSLILLFLACLRLWQLGQVLGTSYWAGTLAGILLLSSGTYLNSTTNGLEVPLFSFLLIEVVYNYCKERLIPAYIYSGLLFMTRPEGLGFGLLLLVLVAIYQRSLHKVGEGVAIIGGFVMAVTLYRYFTYGSLIPNSVIAKSFPLSMLSGQALSIFRYSIGFVKANPYFVILAIGGFFTLIRLRSLKSKSSFVILFCLAAIAFSFVVMARNGGDWMGNYRLLAQYGILYAVLLIVLLEKNVLSILFAAAFVILPFLQATNMFVNFRPIFPPKYQDNSSLYVGVADLLAPLLKPTDAVSAEAIGYIGYHLIDNPVIDPLGLTNAYIARNGYPRIPYGKSDFQYLVETLMPSVMVWHYPGHLKGVDPEQLSHYESYCAGTCEDWSGFLVMIRDDRAEELNTGFAGWKKIDINTEWKR